MIICFGDSWTSVFHSPTAENPMGLETPYGQYLAERLEGSVEIRISGICGELTGEMAQRFRRDVLMQQPSHVVLLGGTNDLGWNAQPADIMKNLLKMYELARAAQITPVSVTVPSICVDITDGASDAKVWLEQHLSRRVELNGLIRKYALSKAIPWIDLFGATTDQATGQLAAPYSNDGLHLSTVGYQLLAQLLYERVFAKVYPSAERRKP